VRLGEGVLNLSVKVFLAGAAGAIGTRLVPLLLDAGYDVFGTTRSAVKADALKLAGVEPIVVDVFDQPALARALRSVRPQIVIHQLTDLPRDPSRIPERLAGNSRIRSEGTRNLVGAAIAAGASRLVAQSIAWGYAAGPEPHSEDDPLDLGAAGIRGVTVAGVAALERLTLNSPPLTGIVLRYGYFYGPGTGRDTAANDPAVHIDAAASAALLAAAYRQPGIFNIAEPNELVATTKARRELRWHPDFRVAGSPVGQETAHGS